MKLQKLPNPKIENTAKQSPILKLRRVGKMVVQRRHDDGEEEKRRVE
jgi:hypothetical protein